jgi:hypothetical protein
MIFWRGKVVEEMSIFSMIPNGVGCAVGDDSELIEPVMV